MNKNEFESYCSENRYTDEWWVAVDEQVMDALMTLEQIENLASELPKAEISVLHLADSQVAQPEWKPFDRIEEEAPAIAEKAETKKKEEHDPELSKKILKLESRVEFLQNTVDAMLSMLAELDSFEELRKSLEERAAFIHRSEEELINKTIQFDEMAAELEQQREDMGMDEQ